MMTREYVTVQDGRAEVLLFLDDPEVVGWLAGLPEEQRVGFAKNALKVGALAFNSAFARGADALFREALERWREQVRASIQDALTQSQQTIVTTLQQQLGQQITPAVNILERTVQGATDRLQEHLNRLEARIDPTRPESWLSAVHEAVEALQEEFDPSREGSYLWQVRNTLSEFFKRDGEATQCINEAVNRSVEGLRDAINQIRQSIDSIAKSLAPTTVGRAFEREAVGTLLRRAVAVTGDALDHVGRGSGAGDWLIRVRFNQAEVGRIVVEAKNSELTRSKVDEALNESMRTRNADIGILIFAELAQNPYGVPFTALTPDGTKIVCVWDEMGSNLNFAYQIARSHLIASYLRQTAAVDRQEILRELQSALQEVERLNEVESSARLARDHSRKAFELAQELRNNLQRRLQRIQQQLQAMA